MSLGFDEAKEVAIGDYLVLDKIPEARHSRICLFSGYRAGRRYEVKSIKDDPKFGLRAKPPEFQKWITLYCLA